MSLSSFMHPILRAAIPAPARSRQTTGRHTAWPRLAAAAAGEAGSGVIQGGDLAPGKNLSGTMIQREALQHQRGQRLARDATQGTATAELTRAQAE